MYSSQKLKSLAWKSFFAKKTHIESIDRDPFGCTVRFQILESLPLPPTEKEMEVSMTIAAMFGPGPMYIPVLLALITMKPRRGRENYDPEGSIAAIHRLVRQIASAADAKQLTPRPWIRGRG